MNQIVQTHLHNLYSDDKDLRYMAFLYLIELTNQPVDWAYTVWDDMVENLSHKDNHVRAIAAQILCNLAKSDPENRMLKDFDALLTVTRDARFVTARHSMQAIWKVGVAGDAQRELLLHGLETRFDECIAEKNCTLIRFDIISDFRKLYDQVRDEKVKAMAMELIETEEDLKYRKKYASLWMN